MLTASEQAGAGTPTGTSPELSTDRQQQQKERLVAYWRLQAIGPDLI